jgi:hypothetical protein
MNRRLTLYRSLTVVLALLAMIGFIIPSEAGILPGNASPRGTSIDEMTALLGPFQDSGLDPSFLPSTRFQILFPTDLNTNTGTFTVKPGTFFFIPIFSFNDSPPIIGDFPTNSSQAVGYIFGAAQIGAHDAEIEVDGQITEIGPSHLSGLINTPNLPFGGSHTILLGAFQTPLPKGTHTVKIRATWDGVALVALVGSSVSFEIVYTVIVK